MKKKISLKTLIIISIVFSTIIFTPLLCGGCAGCEQTASHIKSTFVGLNRRVTLYANDGSVIKTWAGRINIEDQGGSFRFMVNNKAITVTGTVLIEEE
jgi:hypothetical protein